MLEKFYRRIEPKESSVLMGSETSSTASHAGQEVYFIATVKS